MGQPDKLHLRFDAFDLDEADARLKRDGKPVALTPKAFGVLCALARQPGTLVTKNVLLDLVWGHQHVSESVLKTTVSQLRAALADDPSNPRYIETASRLGYRFIAKMGPYPAFSQVGAKPTEKTAPIHLETASDPTVFIGRKTPFARLQEAWRRASAGQRQLVWVAGDAGVGKSTLLEVFTRASGAVAIAQGRGNAAGANRFLQEAVGMARTQEAPGFELKAACALVEHPSSTPADREELGQLVASFTEGLDTPDVVRACRLATAI